MTFRLTIHTALLSISLSLLSSCGREAALDAGALLARAEALSTAGREVEAARLLGAQVESLPASTRGQVRLEMARLYHRSSAWGAALENAERAIRAGVSAPEAHYLKGDSQRRLERLGEAEETLGKVLERDPGHHRARLALACIRFRTSDPASALPLFESYFQAALKSEPELDLALLEHGRALRAAGRYREAADRFASLLEKDPLEATLYSELASSLYRLRLRREARFVEEIYQAISQGAFEEHVEEGLERTGASAFAFAQRAANSVRRRRFLAAFQSYRRAVEIDAAHPLIRIYFAELCLRFRRLEEARAILEGVLPLGPRPASGIWWTLARARIEGREYPAAREAVRKALEGLIAEGNLGGVERGQASLFSLHLIEARAALETGDLPAAEEAALRAGDELPGSWEPFYWRGRVEITRGRFERSLPHFTEALRRGGQRFIDLVHFNALALERSGRREEALRELEKIARSHPGYLPAYEPLLRLLEPGTARARAEEASGRARALRSEIEALEKGLETGSLAGSGEAYLKLGKLHRELLDPAAFDFLFLAADLLPRNPEAFHLLLSGLKGPQDVFVRIHILRRLTELEPGNAQVLVELAELYLRLRVRLDEASSLAGRLHVLAPSATSYRLRGLATFFLGERESARKVLREGLQAFPADGPLREALAQTEN